MSVTRAISFLLLYRSHRRDEPETGPAQRRFQTWLEVESSSFHVQKGSNSCRAEIPLEPRSTRQSGGPATTVSKRLKTRSVCVHGRDERSQPIRKSTFACPADSY